MRPIKFRWRHVDTGEIYYGFYEMDARGNHSIIDSNNIMHIVDPDSIAQLVGYDKDGREVYDGDTLIAADDIEWTAELVHAPVSANGFQHIVDPEKFTLKEVQS